MLNFTIICKSKVKPIGIEIISETETSHDALCKSSNLFTHTGDIHIHGTIEHHHILRPHPVYQFPTGEYPTLFFQQEMEQFKLSLGKRNSFAINANRFLIKIQHQPR